MTVIVVDTSVITHQISNALGTSNAPAEHLKGVIKAQLLWVQSGEWLGSLKPDLHKVVWVCDTKVGGNYWRHEYLDDPKNTKDIPEQRSGRGKTKRIIRHQGDTVAYKAGRKLPDYTFTKIKGLVYSTIADQGWQLLREAGYEADDLAATVVYLNNLLGVQDDILLATVDTDWLGMVSPLVTWFCTYGWYPRVRSADMIAFNYWSQKRLGMSVKEPRDIWGVKVTKGDKSDNLPPGCPLEVIDLFNPPEQHRLWNRPGLRGVIKGFLQSEKYVEVDQMALARALKYLRTLGLQPVIRPFDPDRDLYFESITG